jgi:hypothetical protein
MFLPHQSETLVVVHPWDAVLQRLEDATAPEILKDGKAPGQFTGWIKDDRFQLMLRQRRPNAFAPIIEGRIDPTSGGCIIFLRYKLMPVTRMYLVVWTFIVLGSGVFLLIQYNAIGISLGALCIVVFLHSVEWANFKLHQKPLHDVIFKVLS